ncbi:MAG: TetR/AcrR family transcriptional regulator [Planctomycetota bacterium]
MPEKQSSTRSGILSAASMLFSIHGYKNTTIEDIITAAGITKGAFYHYFKSKEALCQAVIEKLRLDYQQLIDSLDKDAGAMVRLSQMLDRLIELNCSGEWINCRLLVYLSHESHQDQPELEEKIKQFWLWYRTFYEGLLNECRQSGMVRTDVDLKIQVDFLLSLIAGAIVLTKTTPGAINLAELVQAALKSFRPDQQ